MIERESYNENIKNGNYLVAYEQLLESIATDGTTEELVELSKMLSNELRGKAYILSAQKADSQAIELEKLLKKVIKINGESIYG